MNRLINLNEIQLSNTIFLNSPVYNRINSCDVLSIEKATAQYKITKKKETIAGKSKMKISLLLFLTPRISGAGGRIIELKSSSAQNRICRKILKADNFYQRLFGSEHTLFF